MILPVSNIGISSSNGRNLRTSNSLARRNVDSQPMSQIAFGDDGNIPATYNWHSSFRKISDNNKVIRGKSIEQAFTNLYDVIQGDLNYMYEKEASRERAHANDNAIKSTFVKGREYDVNTEIPVSKEKFVKATSGFAREYGMKPNLLDSSAAINNFVVNKLGIPEPKSFLEKWFSVTEDSIHKGLLSETYRLMKKGLIVAENIK